MEGLLIINKPLYHTSMDVICILRGLTGIRRIGHAGTLDPLATGVLLVCLGKATKNIERLMGLEKEYIASINLSAFSETDDAEGPLQPADINHIPNENTILAALQTFQGSISQTPPQYSAVKINGVAAYKHARRGISINLRPRQVTIKKISLLSYQWPEIQICVVCEKGVYIRSLARDLGKILKTGGYISALQRTRIGQYTLKQAHALNDLKRKQPSIAEILLLNKEPVL